MKTLKTQFTILILAMLGLTSIAFGQITPSADAYTNSAAPTTNYGASVLLDVDGATQAAYIQFNLASIPSTYTSADITKATLKIYVNTVPTAGSFNVDYVNGTWAENTITHSLAPALGTTIAASVPITTADKNQFILIDVTAAVQAWLSGTANDGIALVANGTFDATFDSKENAATSHAPELDIVFAGGTGLAGVTTAAGSGLTGGGTSGTLNLGLLTTCTSGQVLQWNGTAWACATPKGSGTVTKVATGAGLTGGPITGSGTLSIATGGVTNAMLADSYAQLGVANTFVGNQTVTGTLTANPSANATAIVGNNTGTAGYGVGGTSPNIGVYGQSVNSSSSGGLGVAGVSNGPFGAGVAGSNNATTGLAIGVSGSTSSTGGFGVVGTQGAGTVVSGIPAGVYGATGSTLGYGVEGTSPFVGVIGTSSTSSGYGVMGNSPAIGVFGGQVGQVTSPAGLPYGVVGASSTTGVYGASSGLSATGGTVVHNNGVWGDYGGVAATGIGVLGTADNNLAGEFHNNSSSLSTVYVENDVVGPGGEVFEGIIPSLGTGVFAIIGDPGCGSGFIALQLSLDGMTNCNNYTLTAGSDGQSYLNAVAGKTVHLRVNNVDALTATNAGVNVNGTLTAGTKAFKIDHPLDPANKYLYHTSVESSEMMNIYTGNTTTDRDGLATVQLADWFEALNTDFRYQLTVIGQFAQAIVASEISGNQFSIRTDKPNVKVSWQVTGVRHDAFANTNRTPVEVEKAPADRGRYLYPEAIGLPTSARIGYDTPPPGSQHIVHQRPTLARRNDASPTVGRAPLTPLIVPAPAMRKPVPPQSIEPQPTVPRVFPLPDPAALASKPEVNPK